jgi:hypothetical protein
MVTIAVLMAAVIGSAKLASFAVADAQDAFRVDYDREQVSLSATVSTVAADNLLVVIADAAGIRVRVRGEVGTVRAQSFDGLPLDVAIQRLFRSPDRSLVMLYKPAPDGGQRLAEVRLSARAARTPQTLADDAPAQLAAAPPVAMPPPPPMHLRLPPPPPPPGIR